MDTCDVCGTKLRILGRFRYAEGYICKTCYKKASRQFTETITKKTRLEIQKLCHDNSSIMQEQNFEITGRIGNYILFDEKNRRICILSNRMTSKQISEPEFYSIGDIETCQICSVPELTKEELENKVQKKENEVIHSLKVRIKLYDEKQIIDIVLISSRVRIKSYAFRQSYHFAKRIQEEIERLQKQ